MLTREENELLTRTGPGTPMGELIRRYWVPVVFSRDLPRPDCPPLRVKLLGERLVAWRASDGRVGLVDERCPHRGASLFFGRNEEQGLRCVYHGWKFDLDGACVDMPSEPRESGFRHKVCLTAYPCLERAGLVWTYMGPAGLAPGFPELEWTLVPESHRYVTRHVQECNWFQGLEGGFDASHLSFLHRGDTAGGTRVVPARYESVETDFGLACATGRPDGSQEVLWNVEIMAMPFHKLITRQPDRPLGGHMWVPIDDEHCMIYSIEYQNDHALTAAELDRSLEHRYIHAENLPGSDRCVRNKDNDYLIDRDLQASGASYTGLKGFGIQDCSIQESMGPILDRTREHLGASDVHLIQLRRLMLRALKALIAGQPLPAREARDYRVRVANFTLPRGRSAEPAVRERIRPGAADATT
jgi:phenylpropionate dioxygenase-like ring-hydroxylating dioxygenase large terminal subunit